MPKAKHPTILLIDVDCVDWIECYFYFEIAINEHFEVDSGCNYCNHCIRPVLSINVLSYWLTHFLFRPIWLNSRWNCRFQIVNLKNFLFFRRIWARNSCLFFIVIIALALLHESTAAAAIVVAFAHSACCCGCCCCYWSICEKVHGASRTLIATFVVRLELLFQWKNPKSALQNVQCLQFDTMSKSLVSMYIWY